MAPFFTTARLWKDRAITDSIAGMADIPFKYALAPMATLSHEALRVLIHRYGDPDEYYSEMIHAPSFITGGKFEPYYVRTGPVPERMVWQITGNDARSMAKATAMLVPYGGLGIDINMGCSAPDIARFGSGIAWMAKESAVTAELVKAVRREIDQAGPNASGGGRHRLGAKIRLGFEENEEKLLIFCAMLVESGIEHITLHPRTKSEKYGRPARHRYTALLASNLSVPVYGNGDVFSAQDARAFREAYPCSGLMIGRGAIRSPWIFSDISDLKTGSVSGSPIDHLEVALFFLETLIACQPAEFVISRARRFFFYYCDNFTYAHHIKMRIQRAQSPDFIRALLCEYFEQCPSDRFSGERPL